jgi:hypothetical protein
MNSPTYRLGRFPLRMIWFMSAAWLVIAAKCSLVWWAMVRWNLPFHPLWIVAPTVVFAMLATTLWLMHHED